MLLDDCCVLLSISHADVNHGRGSFDPCDPPCAVFDQQTHASRTDGLHEEPREPLVVVALHQDWREFFGGHLLKIRKADLIQGIEIFGGSESEGTFACAQNFLLQP